MEKKLNKLSTAIVALLLGIVIITGSGYFEPSAISNVIEKYSNSNRQNSSQTKANNQSNDKTAPVTGSTAKPSQNDEQSNQNDRPDSKKPNYRIEVSTSKQKMYVYDHDTLIKEWLVSTGENNSTPLGKFTIQNRGKWFFSEKYQEGAKWWVSFKDNGVYLFHSVPMDRQKNIIEEEADKLGVPASHGCIRLKVEQAKWIYDNIPEGTPVYIK